MKDKPILFSGDMVRAILEGRKTQTRRTINNQPGNVEGCYHRPDGLFVWTVCKGRIGVGLPFACPFGLPGDHFWVRENIMATDEAVYYEADKRSIDLDKLTKEQDEWIQNYGKKGRESFCIPSIHMPRWASRIILKITNVRAERLQDISEADAKAEGIKEGDNWPYLYKPAFSRLWDSIYEQRSFGWDNNPWVWVIEFEKLPANEPTEGVRDE